jgi:hypothetical protein
LVTLITNGHQAQMSRLCGTSTTGVTVMINEQNILLAALILIAPHAPKQAALIGGVGLILGIAARQIW